MKGELRMVRERESLVRALLVPLTFFYAGISLLALPYFLHNFVPVAESLGIVFLIGSIVAYFYQRQGRLIQSSFESLGVLLGSGISQVRLVSSVFLTRELEEVLSRAYSVKISLGKAMPPDFIVRLLPILNDRAQSTQTAVLIQDPETTEPKHYKESVLFVLQQANAQRSPDQTIAFRFTKRADLGTFIVTDGDVILVMRPERFTEQALFIKMKLVGDFGRAYDKLFEESWELGVQAFQPERHSR